MISNYSDPIVTLNQVYKASAAGTVPTLGACVIGPHYIVRKYEDFGEALRLDSKENYTAEYNDKYSEDLGLSSRPYPARVNGDTAVDFNSKYSRKVFVRNAELRFNSYIAGVQYASDSIQSNSITTSFELVDGNDTLVIKINGNPLIFRDPYAQITSVPIMQGDLVKVTLNSSEGPVISQCTVIAIMRDEETRKYTKCVLSRPFSADSAASIIKIQFYKVVDCYVDDQYLNADGYYIQVKPHALSQKINLLGSDDDNDAQRYPIAAGAFYAEYRVRSDKFVKNYGQVADIDYVEDLLGKICPENPLGIAVASAVEQSQGNFVYFVALQKDTENSDSLVAAYTKALDLIADKDGIYGIVPCTDSKAVSAAILQFVEKQSQEEIPYFKYLYASKEIPTEELVLPTANIPLTITNVESDSISGKIITKVTFAGSPLLQVGTIVKGDSFRYSIYDCTINRSNHRNTIWLDGKYTTTLGESDAAEIYKNLSDNADIIESIIAWKDIANKRCSFVIADDAMYNSTIPVPNYCVAAALAGKRSGTYPHAPLSNVAMKAITTAETHGFTASQSRKLGSAGFWRVGMREDGTCISRRQLTSMASGDVNYDEQSIVCNIDSIGLSLKVTGRQLVGNTNISPTLINILKAELEEKLAQYQLYVDNFIGPQLLSGAIISIKQDPVYKDRIYAQLEGEPPKPFNRFHITFYMR